MNNNKETLRLHAKKIRNTLNIDECSQALITQIRKFETYQKSKNIMIYYPIGTEYNLLELLNDNKNFIFPQTTEKEIIPIVYNPNNGFKKGKFNIYEPIGMKIKDPKNIELIILPALACDFTGNRIGYGKGYYDKFLKKFDNNTKKAIVISEKLIFENIYHEEHDIKADYIITENKIINLSD